MVTDLRMLSSKYIFMSFGFSFYLLSCPILFQVIIIDGILIPIGYSFFIILQFDSWFSCVRFAYPFVRFRENKDSELNPSVEWADLDQS